MAETPEGKVTAAATAVMKALEPLSVDERSRVLQSAAALHGIGLSPSSSTSAAAGAHGGDGGGHGEAPPASATRAKRLSIVEFLRDKNPATNSQRIAAFAYYREHVEGKETFARGDLEHYFATAKLAKPGNYDRDFAGAVRDGWVHEDGNESYLTQHGESAVQDGFGGKAKPRGAAAKKQK